MLSFGGSIEMHCGGLLALRMNMLNFIFPAYESIHVLISKCSNMEQVSHCFEGYLEFEMGL